MDIVSYPSLYFSLSWRPTLPGHKDPCPLRQHQTSSSSKRTDTKLRFATTQIHTETLNTNQHFGVNLRNHNPTPNSSASSGVETKIHAYCLVATRHTRLPHAINVPQPNSYLPIDTKWTSVDACLFPTDRYDTAKVAPPATTTAWMYVAYHPLRRTPRSPRSCNKIHNSGRRKVFVPSESLFSCCNLRRNIKNLTHDIAPPPSSPENKNNKRTHLSTLLTLYLNLSGKISNAR